MTDLTEQEVCIGSLGQQKVYLNWSDVKDICTNAVSEAYEDFKSKLQLKETAYDFDTARLEEENTQLKELLKECKIYVENFIEGSTLINEDHISYILLQRIKEALR